VHDNTNRYAKCPQPVAAQGVENVWSNDEPAPRRLAQDSCASHQDRTIEPSPAIATDPKAKVGPTTAFSCLAGVDSAKLRSWLKNTDVNAITAPRLFVEIGFEPRFVARLTKLHRSHSGRSTQIIFDRRGRVITQVVAVGQVEFIEHLAQALGIPTKLKGLSRGVRALYLAQAILTFLESNPTNNES